MKCFRQVHNGFLPRHLAAALLLAGVCAAAHAQVPVPVMKVTPAAGAGYGTIDVTLAVTMSGWSDTNHGTLTYYDNGLALLAQNLPAGSNGKTSTTIVNNYVGQHAYTTMYQPEHGSPTNGNTVSQQVGAQVFLPIPASGNAYFGAQVADGNVPPAVQTGKLTAGPATITALETDVKRTLAAHLLYVGFTNDTNHLWTNISTKDTANPVYYVRLTSPGGGYTNPQLTVAITPAAGDNGAGATGAASVTISGPMNNQVATVTGFQLLTGGCGYTTPPAVTVSGGGLATAQGTATLGSNCTGPGQTGKTVNSIYVAPPNGGYSAYTAPPTPVFTGGGGSGAAAGASVKGDKYNNATYNEVYNFDVTTIGSGYTSAPNVAVVGGGGSNAATAVAEVGTLGTALLADLQAGRIPLVSWSCAAPGEAIQDSGNDADYIASIGQGLVSISGQNGGKPIMIRWCWEMNDSYRAPAFYAQTLAGQQSEYKLAFQKIVNGIRAAYKSAQMQPNIIWVFNPGYDASGDSIGQGFYPGDEWVDWIGLDKYNNASVTTFCQTPGFFEQSPDSNCDQMSNNGFIPVYTNNTLPTVTPGYDKPLMIGENGSMFGSGVQNSYLTSLLDEFQGQAKSGPSLSQVKAYFYFSSSGGAGDWELDGTPSTQGGLAAFQTLVCSNNSVPTSTCK